MKNSGKALSSLKTNEIEMGWRKEPKKIYTTESIIQPFQSISLRSMCYGVLISLSFFLRLVLGVSFSRAQILRAIEKAKWENYGTIG